MALQGLIGNNTRVGFSASSPVTWTRVPQVMDVKFPGLEDDKLDSTVHSSGNFYQNIPGMSQVTDAEVIILDDPDEVTSPILETLRVAHRNRTILYWRIERPTEGTKTRYRAVEYRGRVGSFVPSTPIKGVQTLMFKIIFSDTDFSVYPAGTPAVV